VTEIQLTKDIVTRFIHALNDKDWDAIRRLCSAGYIHHAPRVPAAELSTYMQTAGRMLDAFPDMRATVHQLVAEGEYVATRYTAKGTHTGDFYGVKPTGRTVTLPVIAILHITGDTITEGWFEFDTADIYHQIQNN
jgi:predicted ester cyclase